MQKDNYRWKENDPSYQGENVDRNLTYGVVKSRSCQNMCCIILFAAYWAIVVILNIASFADGNLQAVGTPIDPNGNLCGSDTSEYQRLVYFVSPFQGFQHRFACVRKCPSIDSDGEYDSADNLTCQPNKYVQGTESEKCPAQLYNPALKYSEDQKNSTTFIYDTQRHGLSCIPLDPVIHQVLSFYLQPQDSFEAHIQDLKRSWPLLVGGIFMTLFFGYFYLILMRFCAVCLTWTSIFSFFITLLVGGGIMWGKANNLGPYESEDNSNQTEELQFFAVCFWLAAVFFIIYICCSLKKIRLALIIVKNSTQFTKDVSSVYMIPFMVTLFYSLFMVYWCYFLILQYSAGSTDNSDFTTPYDQVSWNESLRGTIFYLFFGFLWDSQLHAHFSYFLVSGASSEWYFTLTSNTGSKNPVGPIKQSICRGFRQLGSIIYGAVVIPFASIINFFLNFCHSCSKSEREQQVLRSQNDSQIQYIGQNQQSTQLQSSVEQQQPKKQGCCTSCCISLAEIYEHYFRYVNKSAYSQMAITGNDFCQSAHNSYYLLQRHQTASQSMSGAGVLLIFIGKLFVSGLTSILCYICMLYADQFEGMNSTLLPMSIIIICSYYIGDIFMSLYGASTDCVMQSYCLDEELCAEMNLGPKYATDDLRSFINDNPDFKSSQQKEKYIDKN